MLRWLCCVISILVSHALTAADGASWVNKDMGIFQQPKKEGVALGTKGDLFVMNEREQVIVHLDPNGALLGSFGRKGQGPGELQWAGKLYFQGKYLFVPNMNGITVFDENGTYVKVIKTKGSAIKVANGWVTAGNIYAIDPKELGEVAISFHDEEFGQEVKAMTFPRDKLSSIIPYMMMDQKMTNNFNPAPENLYVQTSPDGARVYVLPPLGRSITLIDTATQAINDHIKLPWRPIAFNQEWGKQQLQIRKEKFKSRTRKATVNAIFPDQFPLVRKFQVGPDGKLYVNRWTGLPDKDAPLLVLDPSGKPADSIFDARMIEHMVGLRGDWAYVILWDKEEETAGIGRCLASKVGLFLDSHSAPLAEGF